MARPTPVLPEVGSTIVPPGLSFPSRSAASIIGRPMRSFTEPPGFRYSSFARICAPPRRRELLEADDRRRADELEDRGELRAARRGSLRRLPPGRSLRPLSRRSRARPRPTGRARAWRRRRPRRCPRSPRSRARSRSSARTRRSWPALSSVVVCVNATVAAIATPSAPPICCDVLISPDARPASWGCDAGERRDRHRDERERHADADEQVAGQQVGREARVHRRSASTRPCRR